MPQDLNRFFQIEAEDLLGRITPALERLRQEPVTAAALRDLRRWIHTLKGAAQVVQREEIAQAAHRLETELDTLAEKRETDSLNRALALVAEMTKGVIPSARAPQDTEEASTRPADPAEPRIESLRIELHDLDDLLQSVNESTITASGFNALFGPLERAKELTAMLRRENAGESAERRPQLVEELAREIADVVEELRRQLDLATEHMQRDLSGLRSQTGNLRLVRAQGLIQVLEQSILAAAGAAGKSVEFVASGAEFELDAYILIAARDALIQLARNAVAHGIEPPDERIAAGKPPAGRVYVNFRREGSRNLLEIRDDGRGIDFEVLREQAVRRGWLTPSQAQDADAQALTQLLLRPGVSTARSTDALSGRGVGLDLVNNAVARLKGDLSISAEPGRGTTIQIRVPANLNSAAVLMVEAGGTVFGIPLDVVHRTVAVADMKQLGDLWMIDDRPMPMIPLAAVLGIEAATASVAIEISAYPRNFLLGVNSLLGVRQTVIHMLPAYVEAEPFVLGASVESEGHLQLILDPAMLRSKLDELGRRQERETLPAPIPLPILVVDDSLTTRMLEQSILEMEGYTVNLAGSAEEGLNMARERSYGLFMVDVEMPGMDGVAFLEKVRQDPELRETPTILITSRGSAEDRARGLRAGAQEYIVKSEFDQRFLLNRVRTLIRTR
jgi:two-component system chemotaxis sensor kinase CheA